jgi:riboflavin kinase/FMN adenylyltransferase
MKKPVVAAIGVFDGVHLGHRALLEAAVRRAHALHAEPVAVTFDRHPLSLVSRHAAPPVLMPRHLCVEKLRLSGMGRVIVLPFTRRLAKTPAADFVRDFLVKKLGVSEVVTGADFRFGRGGAGNIRLLRSLGRKWGFRVRVVPPARAGGIAVSSTFIRRLIMRGRVAEASRLLGHSHLVEGRVVQGLKLARKLGFPTINIAPVAGLLPPLGVYAVLAGAKRIPGVANLGLRPTVVKHARFPLLEVHCLTRPPKAVPGGLIRTEMLAFLRPERKFAGTAELVRAVRRDIEKARRILRRPPPPPFF